MSSYELEKAADAARRNKFVRKVSIAVPREREMPEILQVEEGGSSSDSRPATHDSAQNREPPLSVDARLPGSAGGPTPPDKPFAGMREQGTLRTGVARMDALQAGKTGPGGGQKVGKRVSMAESIQQLGEMLASPFSPSSPSSPSTMRSPLRFFRAREDRRDQILAQTKTEREAIPVLMVRERNRDKAVSQMDQGWEQNQRRQPLRSLVKVLSAASSFIRYRILSGWTEWLKNNLVVDDDNIEEYMTRVKSAPQHSRPRLLALESIYNLTYTAGNQLVMIQNEMLALLMAEVRSADDGSQHQAVALAIIRNLCLYSGYRVAAAKEVTGMLIAVCWSVEDHKCKEHALGALANLAANERPGELLLDQEIMEVLLYLAPYGSNYASLLSDEERVVRCCALMALFNLAVVSKNRPRILKHQTLEMLLPLLQQPALIGLLTTLTSMQLIQNKGHPMLIFSERQPNIPDVVRCLGHAIHGTKMYGITWNPRHVLHAVSTLMLFEPNHRQLVKAGIDALLILVVFGQHPAVRTKYWMDRAREMRQELQPLVARLREQGLVPDEAQARA